MSTDLTAVIAAQHAFYDAYENGAEFHRDCKPPCVGVVEYHATNNALALEITTLAAAADQAITDYIAAGGDEKALHDALDAI